jgi:hypothetical protein
MTKGPQYGGPGAINASPPPTVAPTPVITPEQRRIGFSVALSRHLVGHWHDIPSGLPSPDWWNDSGCDLDWEQRQHAVAELADAGWVP